MLVTLQLDQCTLPETGQVELNIQRLFEINISVDEARRIINRWFRNEVTMSFLAEMPTLVIDKKIVWRVPAFFTSSQIGKVGLIGLIDVDVATGDMDTSEKQKKALFEKADEFVKHLPPFQPRTIDPKYLAKEPYQPNVNGPQGNPFEIIAAGEAYTK